MEKNKLSFKTKIMTMSTVKEMTGLSERQIRYYEEKKLVFPDRSPSGIRKYSLSDIRLLINIAEQIKKGVRTDLIREQIHGENLSIS
ncbi:MerR family transcriptional regulator [Priestia endophytica]|uniref:MerR family transcriptional regulator n=1 Tax=Priestia endophytica TaxID=135735 RepID=UPI000DCA7F1C|nr:MerR family transcriptional regulator [Priestia endophytica]RAS74552.1 MerR family DNA-binding transcriptional regulator [Priestia endophytica]RAS81905.1 MerR family DNA-binding transcriptional regulator [Priestia endophytica]